MKGKSVVSTGLSVERRTFLGQVSAAGATIVWGGLSSQPTPAHAATQAARFTPRNFEPLVGHRFQIETQHGQHLLITLEKVRTPGKDASRPSNVRQEPFALTFRIAAGEASGDIMGIVRHPGLPEFQAFFVRVGPPRAAAQLEAVFG